MDNGRLNDMTLARREEQELHGPHERSVGEHSSVRNRTGVLASPLVESNRILLRKAITLAVLFWSYQGLGQLELCSREVFRGPQSWARTRGGILAVPSL